MISLFQRCCSKVLNQGFLSCLPWSRDAAVSYWTMSFYHDFLDRAMLQFCTETRVSIMICLVEGCCSTILNHGFLSWFPWWRDAAVRYWTKGFYHDFLVRGILQYGTEPKVSIMISMVEGCCSKLLNQGFLSLFHCSRDTAVKYWTKGFYHDFLDRGMQH
jgi:hypothetical protein